MSLTFFSLYIFFIFGRLQPNYLHYPFLRFQSYVIFYVVFFEVSSSLMYDLHMSLQLHSAGQQLATHVTREEFLGHHLTLGVHSMLTRPEIRGSVICKKNQLSVNTCVQTETWPWHTLLDSIHS